MLCYNRIIKGSKKTKREGEKNMKVRVNVFENVLSKGNYFATINDMDGKELCRFSYDNEANALLETIKYANKFGCEVVE